MAVILNALRALGGYKERTVRGGRFPAMAQRFQAEHADLLPLVGDLRRLADRLEAGGNGGLITEVREATQSREPTATHEDAEEHQLPRDRCHSWRRGPHRDDEPRSALRSPTQSVSGFPVG